MPPFLHLGGVDAAVAAAIRQERPPIPRAWDEKITHLLQAAWSENPASRPSFQKALDTLREYYKANFKASLEDDLKKEAAENHGKECVIC
mmetsp:Transcript_17911/g.57667  ORF Transcript_17911/g.57667 Transcript_17911/m.57667 type:complete len:90 (-) Transcript_17911:324-593(-)